MSFTDIYTGSPVNPQDISYRAVTLAANTTLEFPVIGTDTINVIARIMNVTASSGGLTLTLPPANQTGIGFDTLVRNNGANSFDVVGNTGVAVATIAAGESFYIYLTDNSTVAGAWSSLMFGTGTSSADAATLAGYGLTAITTTLNTEHDVDTVPTNITIDATDRAKLKNWTGGGGTYTLPTAASAGNGFFFLASNNGTGALSINPNGAETIDGSSTTTLAQGESCFIFCSGSAWFTVGQGRSITTSVTRLTKGVGGSSNVALTSAEAAYSILEFTGTLTGNIDVTVPAAVGRWTIYNNTSGAFTLTFKPVAGTGVAVTQGKRIDLYSDGANAYRTHDVSFTLTAPAAGITATGSPVLDTGTVTLALADDLAALEGLSGQGLARRTGANTWSLTDDFRYIPTVGGTVDTITLTSGISYTAYKTGMLIAWITSGSNTGAVTVNLDGLGAKALVKLGATALAIGDMQSGLMCMAVYDGVNFQLVSMRLVKSADLGNNSVTTAALNTNAVTTVKITDANVTYAKIQNVSAQYRLLGRSSSGAGVTEEITTSAVGLALLDDTTQAAQQATLGIAIVDTAYAGLATYSNTTAVIPLDDTIPQSGEGVTVLSTTISPKSATNKLRIRAVVPVGFNATAAVAIGALFVGTGTVGANAVAATAATGATTTALQNMVLQYEYTPATTSSQTIEVRVGTGGAGGIGINGTNAARLFGGVTKATITVEEIRA